MQNGGGPYIFCHHRFQRLDVQRLFGDDVSEPSIFVLELFRALHLAELHPAILRLPAVVRLLGDPVGATQVGPPSFAFPDVSKAAINDLVRELAIGLGPLVRVNAIAPATVIAGSAMFPRDRVIVSLKKYCIEFDESESTDALRNKLAEFYAQRTITHRPVLPIDNANAICWLAGDQSAKTTGHVIPVDGGLSEAFLR